MADLWTLTTGGIDDFDLTVEKAYFATSAEYNNGQTLLLNLVGSTDLENPELRTDFTVSFACGNGWASEDGKTAYHEVTGQNKSFNRNSIVGNFVSRALGELGLADELKGKSELGPLDASIWVGYTFHFNRIPISFGSGLEPKEKLMPTAVSKAGSVAAAAAPAVDTATATTLLEAQVRAVAQQVKAAGGDHQAFVKAATAIDGVIDSPVLEAVINANAGIWAETNG